MDLTQSKLSRTEWTNIEVSVPEDELFILKMINKGSSNVNIKTNRHQSIIQLMKLEKNPAIESCLYEKYFQPHIEKIAEISGGVFRSPVVVKKETKALKRGDSIRIENMDVSTSRSKIFEYILLDFCYHLVAKCFPPQESKSSKSSKTKKTATKQNDNCVPSTKPSVYYLYSLIQLRTNSIENINPFVQQFVDEVIVYAKKTVSIPEVVRNAYEIIEQNPYILKYEDISLYPHQKELFSIFNRKELPKLVLYMAPTGTGKTMSPIGLSNKYRVIFVCVARHVGLALAKSAISVEKKIAFAFGCETASDIRLHYFAATDYTINRRSGGIGKVDNSVGDKVEIMICDVKSYLVAMQYMLAFNPENKIVTYWDEPTITMDYETHDLHEQIHRNWTENRISKLVLSCATLPKEEEMTTTIMDFQFRFENAEIFTINSYDCKKTISLLGKDGKPALPHLLFSQYDDLQRCAEHCNANKSLLRYFDLKEIIRFIECVNRTEGVIDELYRMEYYFEDNIQNVTMNGIKTYYLELLQRLNADRWEILHAILNRPVFDPFPPLRTIKSEEIARPTTTIFRQNSVSIAPHSHPVAQNPHAGILLTTTDAHTLTDGPTIYLAEDIQKIGTFLIHQTQIPERVFNVLMERIAQNNVFQKKLTVLEKTLEDKLGKDMDKSKKMERENFSGEVRTIMTEIDQLRSKIFVISMDKVYIPNTPPHQNLWLPSSKNPVNNAFIPDIDECAVKEIMALDVDTNKKLLLILGIGMFDSSTPVQYMEIMKRLATEQKLFIIVASSDYIYGTNYQFCHGFIGKDLQNMTQQKIIQSMGRIGRNKVQQEYTVRFRDDDMMKTLFLPPTCNREAEIMAQLFSS